MAATETLIKNQCNMLLNVGTTTTGATKTANMSLGTLSSNVANWDGQKAINIATAVSNVLENTLVELRRIATSRLEES